MDISVWLKPLGSNAQIMFDERLIEGERESMGFVILVFLFSFSGLNFSVPIAFFSTSITSTLGNADRCGLLGGFAVCLCLL